ncbi:MAG TPA: helix-turn-helix domain-containing protein [Candidatus Thermoplasmatota archaeon]|nr:helix-turn-helix domain-containing protein [Candidatus Thermoplasmatota archaeon]
MRHRADDEGWLLGFAALFTRLRRPALLDQPTRRRIHELVEADPGILFSHLRKRLALPAGVATHHLQVLEAHGLVASVRAGSRRHLYPAGRAPSGAPLPAHAQRILSLLGSGARPQQEIARALPLTPQGVSYHLQTLLAAGRLVRERDGSGRWVYHARGAADAS